MHRRIAALEASQSVHKLGHGRVCCHLLDGRRQIFDENTGKYEKREETGFLSAHSGLNVFVSVLVECQSQTTSHSGHSRQQQRML